MNTVWEYTAANDCVTITRCLDFNCTHKDIPSRLYGLPVTAIANNCFDHCNYLESLTIPETVTDLLDMAFACCSQLKSIYLHENITYVSPSAFNFCPRLERVEVSPLNRFYTAIDGILYKKKPYTLLYFPGSIEGEFSVPDGVEIIAEKAFAFSSLKFVTIPESVQKIGPFAFDSSRITVTAPHRPEYYGFKRRWYTFWLIGEQ